jgi:hypothetical protein
MIFGLTIQVSGVALELRCPECVKRSTSVSALVRESAASRIRIYCEFHPNFGEWQSEAEMEREKLDLARRIGLLD